MSETDGERAARLYARVHYAIVRPDGSVPQTGYTTHVQCGPLGTNSPSAGQSNLYKLAVVLTYANGGPEYITGFTEEIMVRTL